MKFLDQTSATELITLVKKALKPLESMKSSITDVNGIVKSDGSGGFSAATAGTDYAAASHTHDYLPLTGGTVTGAINYPNAESVYDTEGTVMGTNFLLLDNNGQIVRTSVSDTSLISELGGATKKHSHTKADITDFPSSMTPSAHKDTHKTGGSDALTPADIGAAAASHTHNYLPLSGGSLSGNLVVGNARVQANGYVVSTWLQTTQTSDKAGNFATIDGDGWIYYRTPAETLGDIGAAAASHNHPYLPLAGGTMIGSLVAQNNTSYTSAQVRNVIISSEDPSGGNNGDIWLKYEADPE